MLQSCYCDNICFKLNILIIRFFYCVQKITKINNFILDSQQDFLKKLLFLKFTLSNFTQ